MCVSAQLNREDGSGSGFGSWKTVLAVPVPRSVPGKTVPTVPVSGSGSVPGPHQIFQVSLKHSSSAEPEGFVTQTSRADRQRLGSRTGLDARGQNLDWFWWAATSPKISQHTSCESEI